MFKVGDEVRPLTNSGYSNIYTGTGKIIKITSPGVYRVQLKKYLKEYPNGLTFFTNEIKKVKQNWFQKLFSR